MSVFDSVYEKLITNFSEWVEIYDDRNPWTIESFSKINFNEQLIKPHCVDCTIINQCWFKNEEGKKPEEFNYLNAPLIPINKRGLYHPNCHCETNSITKPNPNQIIIFDLERRMDYLFLDKKDWLLSMGYNIEDKQEVFQLIESLSKESYCNGNYTNNPPPKDKKKYGFRIRIKLQFPGKREKANRIFPITSSYIVYPNGQLKNNTPIGGWTK